MSGEIIFSGKYIGASTDCNSDIGTQGFDFGDIEDPRGKYTACQIFIIALNLTI